jgi:hypothetical protein
MEPKSKEDEDFDRAFGEESERSTVLHYLRLVQSAWDEFRRQAEVNCLTGIIDTIESGEHRTIVKAVREAEETGMKVVKCDHEWMPYAHFSHCAKCGRIGPRMGTAQ